MLIDWKPKSNDPGLDRILSLLAKDTVLPGLVEGNSKADEHVEQHPGIYLIGHFNGSHVFPEDVFDQYPSGLPFGSYGVCDGVDNLMEKIPELVTSEREFVVTMTRVRRDEQSPEGGWRWHKWGEYIGSFDSQCEYLYDEEGIDEVYCYHIFERVKVIPLNELKHGEYYGTTGMSSFFDGVRWDGVNNKFKTFMYDHEKQDMMLKEYEYTAQWNRRTRDPAFAPVSVYRDEVRRKIRFDDEPPLLEHEA